LKLVPFFCSEKGELMDLIHPVDLMVLECHECGTGKENLIETRDGILLCEECFQEIYKLKTGQECPKCHLIAADDFVECPRCWWPRSRVIGSTVSKKCDVCNRPLPAEARTCSSCGREFKTKGE
jgi:predicted amidophosphoribosyltransferase